MCFTANLVKGRKRSLYLVIWWLSFTYSLNQNLMRDYHVSDAMQDTEDTILAEEILASGIMVLGLMVFIK